MQHEDPERLESARRRRPARFTLALAALALAGACTGPGTRVHRPDPATPRYDLSEGRCGSLPVSELRQDEWVVLIHGLANSRLSLRSLRDHLLDEGYTVVTFAYPSLFRPLEYHVDDLRNELQTLSGRSDVREIHVVGHSLGGVLARMALQEEKPDKLGRVVIVATPSLGSPRATTATPWVGWLMPVVPQLSDGPESVVLDLPEDPELDLGVIAGASDSTVPPERTHTVGQRDHVVVSGGHRRVLQAQESLRQVEHFLRKGHFLR